jgi:hypothetical protein
MTMSSVRHLDRLVDVKTNNMAPGLQDTHCSVRDLDISRSPTSNFGPWSHIPSRLPRKTVYFQIIDHPLLSYSLTCSLRRSVLFL